MYDWVAFHAGGPTNVPSQATGYELAVAGVALGVIMLEGPNTALVISCTVVGLLCQDDGRVRSGWGYGIKLVWNSEISTFKAPSKRREAAKEDNTTWATRII